MTHNGPLPVAWRDLDREQRACLRTISKACETRRDADFLAWTEARRARDLNVPERMIAERLQVSRATLQRQLAQRFPTVTDEHPSDATPIELLPNEPPQVTVSYAVEPAPTTRPTPTETTDAHGDLALETTPTRQPPHQTPETTDAAEYVVDEDTVALQGPHRTAGTTNPTEKPAAEPAPTLRLPPEEEVGVWSRSCLSDAMGSELLTVLTERVEAMPYKDVVAYWNALSAADRNALVEALSDLELRDELDAEASMRIAVVLHQLHLNS